MKPRAPPRVSLRVALKGEILHPHLTCGDRRGVSCSAGTTNEWMTKEGGVWCDEPCMVHVITEVTRRETIGWSQYE